MPRPAGDGNIVVDPEGKKTTFQYDMDSRQTTILYQSGIKHLANFDAIGRQTKFEDFQPSGADWQRLTYTYDNVGKPLQILDGSREFTQFGYGPPRPHSRWLESTMATHTTRLTTGRSPAKEARRPSCTTGLPPFLKTF